VLISVSVCHSYCLLVTRMLSVLNGLLFGWPYAIAANQEDENVGFA